MQAPAVNTMPSRYYQVYWTPNAAKKCKVFKDGFLRMCGRSAELLDEKKISMIKSFNFKTRVDEDGTRVVLMNNHEIQIEAELDSTEFEAALQTLFGPPKVLPKQRHLIKPTPHPDPGEPATHTQKRMNFLPKTKKDNSGGKPKGGSAKKSTPEKKDKETAVSQKKKKHELSTLVTGAMPTTMPKFQNPVEPGRVVSGPPSNNTDPNSDAFLCKAGEGAVVRDCIIEGFLMKVLMPHQLQGIKFMFRCVTGINNPQVSGCILGDSMGLGKSLQVISVIWALLRQSPWDAKNPMLKKVVLLAPVSVVRTWKKEISKWLDDNKLYPVVVNPKDENIKVTLKKFFRESFRCLVLSYETLLNHFEEFEDHGSKIDMLVCDEGHRLKNHNTKLYKALDSLPVKRRIILTGTPIQNNLSELHACIRFVNPSLFKNAGYFSKQYAEPIEKGMGREATERERELAVTRSKDLMGIVSTFMIRRTLDTIKDSLPPRREFLVYLTPTEVQIELYDKCLELCKEAMFGMDQQTTAPRSGELLGVLIVLRRLLNHPKLLLASEMGDVLLPLVEEWKKKLGDLELIAGSHKMRFVRTVLLKALPRGEKVVLVSYFTQTLDLLEQLVHELGVQSARIDGSMIANKRQDSVNRFNDEFSGCNVLLLGAKAGGTGLNLTGGSRMILMDLDWNPSNDSQVMGRIYRQGQKKPVSIYRLLTFGTVEEKMLDRQTLKTDLNRFLMDEVDASVKFTDEEIKALLNFYDPAGSGGPFLSGRDDDFDWLVEESEEAQKNGAKTLPHELDRSTRDFVRFVLAVDDTPATLFSDAEPEASVDGAVEELDQNEHDSSPNRSPNQRFQAEQDPDDEGENEKGEHATDPTGCDEEDSDVGMTPNSKPSAQNQSDFLSHMASIDQLLLEFKPDDEADEKDDTYAKLLEEAEQYRRECIAVKPRQADKDDLDPVESSEERGFTGKAKQTLGQKENARDLFKMIGKPAFKVQSWRS